MFPKYNFPSFVEFLPGVREIDTPVSVTEEKNAIQLGVNRFGLTYINEQVQQVLDIQLEVLATTRYSSDSYPTIDSTDFNAEELLKMLKSYIRKSQLKDRDNDLSRLTPSEAHELERFYEFLKSEDGIEVLQRGIISTMQIEPLDLQPRDLRAIRSLHKNISKERIREVIRNIDKISEFASSVEESWKLAHEYIFSIRKILIAHYWSELEFLEPNFEQTTQLMNRVSPSDRARLQTHIDTQWTAYNIYFEKLKKLENEVFKI